jgi:hypothetical protein
MKTIIISLLILSSALSARSQTVSLTFQGQDWAWLIGKNVNAINSDSASATEFRKIRDAIRTANPQSWTTNVTVNNVPEWVAMAFYRTAKTANAGEIAARYSAITSQIESKASLATQIATFNTILSNDYDRVRTIGKTIVMDN